MRKIYWLSITSALFGFPAAGLADSLSDDVQKIKAQGSPKVLRCVLNKRPRCLAIQLSETMAVAYDTWRGGLVTAWKPADPKAPFKLDGAVFTGRHGPQPSTNGQSYFFDKELATPKYRSSNSGTVLRYHGHQIGKNGLVTLKFSLVDVHGKRLAGIEDVCAAKDGKLFRKVTVSGLADGTFVEVDFPSSSQWSGVTGGKAKLDKNGSQTFTASLK